MIHPVYLENELVELIEKGDCTAFVKICRDFEPPKYGVGDHLWVKEDYMYLLGNVLSYRAIDETGLLKVYKSIKWKNGHSLQWKNARVFLKVLSVVRKPIQELTPQDFVRIGLSSGEIEQYPIGNKVTYKYPDPWGAGFAFSRHYWDIHHNRKEWYEFNPLIYLYTFVREDKPDFT